MRRAALGALCFHLLLLALMPTIPQWTVFSVSQRSGLNVVIQKPEAEFDQRLNNPLHQLSNEFAQEASRANMNLEQGVDELETPASEPFIGSDADQQQSQAVGLAKENRVSPKVYFGYYSVKMFIAQEAVRHTEIDDADLARFNRTFNSPRIQQRNSKETSYANRYGEQNYNVRSSAGDICFKKTAEKITRQTGTFDTNTYMVHFFRCKDKEVELGKG